MSRISAIGQTYINRISFKAEENKPKTEEQPPVENEGMSQNAKIGAGVGAALALVALGVAGYHGKLGKGIQKMLGNGEKAVDDLSKKGSEVLEGADKKASEALGNVEKAVEKTEKNSSEVVTSAEKEAVSGAVTVEKAEVPAAVKTPEAKTEAPSAENNVSETIRTSLSNKLKNPDELFANLSSEEKQLFIKDLFEDKPVLSSILTNEKILKMSETDDSVTLLNMIHERNKLNSKIAQIPNGETLVQNIVGKDSVLFKKVSDLTVKDIKSIINLENIAFLDKLELGFIDKLDLNIDKDHLAVFKLLDSLDPSLRVDKLMEMFDFNIKEIYTERRTVDVFTEALVNVLTKE